MSGDYKWDMQLIAEDLAQTLYGKDFYDLDGPTQYTVYNQAIVMYTERMADRADYLRKAERENPR
jgi:hypothetical protein